MWDLRTHKCLQTIAEDDWVRRDVDTPESITYDPHHRRLISAQHHPYIWHHKMTCLDRTGHRDPLRGEFAVLHWIVLVCGRLSGTHAHVAVPAHMCRHFRELRYVPTREPGTYSLRALE